MDECLIHQYPALEREHFWWVSRRELVTRLLGDTLASMSVLDVGCGSGALARELGQVGATVTSVDVASHAEWLTDEPGGPVFIEGDYLELSPTLGHFHHVLALDVMEHVEDDVAMAAALRANTKPGGSVIVTVPAYSWLWSEHDEINRHHRRYDRTRLSDALQQGGLDVERCGYLFLGLVAPKLILKGVERLRRDPMTIRPPAGAVNGAALAYFRREHRVAMTQRNFLPAGTSVIAVCRRGP